VQHFVYSPLGFVSMADTSISAENESHHFPLKLSAARSREHMPTRLVR